MDTITANKRPTNVGHLPTLRARLNELGHRAVLKKQAILKRLPALVNDVRPGSLGRLQGVLLAGSLGVDNWIDMLSPTWWDSRRPGNPPEAQLEGRRAYQEMLVTHMALATFMTLESTMRALLRSRDADACLGGLGQFNSVFDCLLGSGHLALLTPKWTEFKTYFFLIRNAQHNNGIHHHREGDKHVRYREKDYAFIEGAVAPFEWDDLFAVIEDTLDLLSEIVDHPAVAGVTTEIRDVGVPEDRALPATPL